MATFRPGPSQQQRTRFAPVRLRSIWSNIVTHLTPPSHPSTTSESALDSSLNHTDTYYGEGSVIADPSSTYPNNPSGSHALQHLNQASSRHSTGTRARLRRIRSRRGGKSSAGQSNSRYGDDDDPNMTHEPVSHLVVDNNFEHFTPPPAKSDSGTSARTPGLSHSHAHTTATPGDGDMDTEGWGKDEEDVMRGERYGTKSDASALERAGRWITKLPGYEFTTERAWPNLKHFFDSSYPEKSKERSFQKEAWFNQKQGALASALYLLVSWALTTGLLPLPLTKFNWWAYFGLAGVFAIPVVPFVVFDFPRRHPRIWQPYLLGATWVMADIIIGEMYACDFFASRGANQCGTRNFLNFLGFAYGFPVLALLALKQNRLWAMLGAAQWLILVGVLLVHQGHAPKLFYRNMVNFALFHAFLIGTSFLKERSDRQMFSLRQQLKIQYRATQSAQVMERRASDSKKRFVSYIFHEVRVPLNTALLAVQNLEGENVFKGLDTDQGEMVHGLMGSLTMMEKVLNDVLSFNRMESGKFAQARKPFEFHKSIQLVALSHRMQAQMAGIDLIVDLDSAIDRIGGVFVGDEMRLRQVASNLVSNSIKFTDTGCVRIVTKLLYPRIDPTPAVEADDPLRQAALNLEANLEVTHAKEPATGMERHETLASTGTHGSIDIEKGSIAMEARRMHKDVHDARHGEKERERIEDEKRRSKAVVRVEVHDTGVGLKKSDVIDNRLFSPYVQTEIGRRQGGKGSGLGLALVRQIVKLSNGRLGVESEAGKGSMFWFELPYSLPPPSRSRQAGSHSGHGGSGPGNGGGGGGDGSPWRPAMSRSSTVMNVTTPALGVISEGSGGKDAAGTGPASGVATVSAAGTATAGGDTGPGAHEDANRHLERPEMVTTESTMPLLADRRRSSSIGNETALSTTFPPVESSPESETPSDNMFVQAVNEPDPFRAGSVGRRSSDMSGLEGKTAAVSQIDFAKPRVQVQAPREQAPAQTQAQAEPNTALPARPSAVPSPQPSLCALVVDDDKLTRMLMSRMLRRLGHQVTTAENGKIALDMIRDSFEGRANAPKFDVVFLDNQMPLMSGVEVAREVREMGNPIFIAGCTGNALREDQDAYIGAGADEIIPKPIHQKSVEEAVKAARRRVRGETVPRGVQDE